MAILYHMLADAGQDSEDFATFDLIWIVSSFHTFHEEMPKHAVDMFADLTVASLRCIIPEFVAGMHLPSEFRTFAGVWGDTHIFRNIGLVLDFVEALNNLWKVSKVCTVPGTSLSISINQACRAHFHKKNMQQEPSLWKY